MDGVHRAGGDPGPKGATGDKGAKGDKCARGDTGPKGDCGPAGVDGSDDTRLGVVDANSHWLGDYVSGASASAYDRVDLLASDGYGIDPRTGAYWLEARTVPCTTRRATAPARPSCSRRGHPRSICSW